MFIGFNGNSYGVGLEAGVNVGRGKSNSSSNTYQNSVINVNKLETFSEEGALVLDAAVINAGRWEGVLKDVVFNSRQDTTRYKSEQMQAGASGSIAYGSGGGASVSVGYNNAKMNMAQVNEQTGVHVGK
ncbi:hemagglutinin repeat-containing protein, partial [Muribacter muris]|nr:hemagglutinin repeat-containing protein [Muribacter muris]